MNNVTNFNLDDNTNNIQPHPIKQSLEACKTYFEVILESPTITELDPTVEKVTHQLINTVNEALIELHKLLMATEYTNELIESLQTKLQNYEVT